VLNDIVAMSAGESVGSPPIGQTVTSLWQSNSVALVVGRYANWKRIRAGSVGVITGATYGGAGSPA
jgi:hypothetical protein